MTPQLLTAPYGGWPSPLSAASVVRKGVRLSYPTVIGQEVWWQETAAEDGRTTIVHRAGDGTRTTLLAEPWDAHTRVHEYGGRSYLPVRLGDGHGVIFSNRSDQRLYLIDPGGEPQPITPSPGEPGGLRFADYTLSPDRREVWCVQERHRRGGRVTRAIVAVPLNGRGARSPHAIRELVRGADFFAYPQPSPDGLHVAYIAWSHPKMPWDGTELRVAQIKPDGSIGASRTIKGGREESVLAPRWRDHGSLYMISDWSGWWNLYLVGIFGEPPQALYPAEEEFAGPLWNLGGAPYAVLGDGRLAVLHGHGHHRLGILDPATATLTDVDLPYAEWTLAVSADSRLLAGVAGGPQTPASVVRVDAVTTRVEVLRRELDELPDIAYLPAPNRVEFTGPGRSVYAHVYPPSNPTANAGEGASAPYVLWVHGGPTAQAGCLLDADKAYFTSRGIGIVDVNYGGSTGYGRAYRERLRRQWGVIDVEDVLAVARGLVERGITDADRLAIRGASAGGFTVLATLTRTDAFRCGTAYYPVTDLAALAAQTHDFESRYVEGLVGPADPDLYARRSPLTHADQVRVPVLLFHGLDDPVVPAEQCEQFAKALWERQVPHAYLAFAGESHGFRKAETKIACLEAELSFYGQVFGFSPDVPRLSIEHWKASAGK